VVAASKSPMRSVSEKLTRTIEHHASLLQALTDDGAAEPGRWSKREVLGHLVDSASNNHQRFVRALLQDELIWPGYDQEGSVRVQRYGQYPWKALIEFWAGYNRLLAHIIGSIPDAKRSTICRIGDNPPMTLEELAIDYIRHLEHHLQQLTKAADSRSASAN
jgi:DinB family protein